MKLSICNLLLILVLFSPSKSLCEIYFINPKDEAWKERTISLIREMNAFLPESIEKPNTFNVAYVEDADASYRYRFNYINEHGAFVGIDRVIVVGDELESSFVHEYGHLIFDNHLRFNFPLWQFHVIVNEIPSSDVEGTADDLERAINSLRASVENYESLLAANPDDAFAGNALENLTRSLDIYIPRLRRLRHALEIQSGYDIDLRSINHFQHLISYNELFADFFAVSFANDWSYMKTSVLNSLEIDRNPNRFTLPPVENFDEAVILMGQLRDFRPDLDVSTYEFQDWEQSSPYWEFSPTKSYLRSIVESGAESHIVLSCLINSVISSHQRWVETGANLTPTLIEKNELLIESLRTSCPL